MPSSHEPPAAPRPSFKALRAAAGLLLVVAASAALLGWLQTATEGLYGYDGYYHVRYAQVLRSQGLSRTFPWWQETFLRDHFADKEFLYHVLLIPFTFGDLVTGGKVAAVLFGALAVGIFYLAASRLRVPWPEAWTLFLVASSAPLLYRLGFTRPVVLAVALAVAGTSAILLEDRRWAFAFAAVYPHVHISFHLLPCVALLHDLHSFPRSGVPGRRRFGLTGWTAAGAAAGALLSPYVPNNLYLWWVQNIRVLGMAWNGPQDLRLGLEIQPGTADQLLKYNVGVFLCLAAAVYLLARGRRPASRQALTLLVISIGFLVLTMMSRRFVEFWAPFTILLGAVVFRDEMEAVKAARGRGAEGLTEGSGPSRGARAALQAVAAAVAAVVIGALAWGNSHAARSFVDADEGLYYADASAWMAANVPAGETIFHLDWDDFPQLFFFNPQFHYLVGLDPTFMYLTNPERWRLWSDVAHAEVDDLYTPIRRTFGCRWVFGIPEAEDFLRFARRDPRFFVRYQDSRATVLFLADDYAFVTHWKVIGWYPNATRLLLDVPLGPEPGSKEPAAVEPVGPGAGGVDVSATSGFLDLDAALGITTVGEDACAIAEGSLDSAAPDRATLAVTTDDEVKVYVNGSTVLEHSPLRSPEPGMPGGATASLDQFIDEHSHVPERSATIQLHPGANPLIVKTCRAGKDFGFFLRAYRADGTPVSESAR